MFLVERCTRSLSWLISVNMSVSLRHAYTPTFPCLSASYVKFWAFGGVWGGVWIPLRTLSMQSSRHRWYRTAALHQVRLGDHITFVLSQSNFSPEYASLRCLWKKKRKERKKGFILLFSQTLLTYIKDNTDNHVHSLVWRYRFDEIQQKLFHKQRLWIQCSFLSL